MSVKENYVTYLTFLIRFLIQIFKFKNIHFKLEIIYNFFAKKRYMFSPIRKKKHTYIHEHIIIIEEPSETDMPDRTPIGDLSKTQGKLI